MLYKTFQVSVNYLYNRYPRQNYAIVGYNATSRCNSLPTFRNKLSVPSSRIIKMGLIRCPETSVRNYHSSLCNNPQERSSHLVLGGSQKSQGCPSVSFQITPFHVCSVTTSKPDVMRAWAIKQRK